jgi:hypothetical protein
LLAEQITTEARKRGQKLAREVLDDLMHTFLGMAAKHQPQATGMPLQPGQEPNETKFVQYAVLARDTAKELAPFQSPKFKSIEVYQAPMAPIEQPGAAATSSKLTPQQAYRLLRDSDIIDTRDSAVSTAALTSPPKLM